MPPLTERPPVCVTELIAEAPALFCEQSWYRHEHFAGMLHDVRDVEMPPVLATIDGAPNAGDDLQLVPAAALVALFLEHPNDPIWHFYHWTEDVDDLGQPVYVGGATNERGFEIHRHLKLTSRWRVPRWPHLSQG